MNSHQINEYSISIYDQIPFFIQIFLILNICFGVTFALSTSKSNEFFFVLIGILIIIINYIYLFSWPNVLGYAFYGQYDPLAHAGFIKDIAISGNNSARDFYPASHILAAIASLITNMKILKTMMLIPLSFSMIYFGFIYLFINLLIKDKFKLVSILASSYIPLLLGYHTLFTANGLGLLLVPLMLYLFFIRLSKSSYNYNILLVILLLIIPFYHILSAILVLYVFFEVYIFILIFNKSKNKIFYQYTNILNNKPILVCFSPLLILFITSVLWFSNSYMWSGSIKKVVNWFAGEVANVPLSEVVRSLNTATSFLDFSEFIWTLFKWLGGYLLFGFLALLGFLFIIKKFENDRIENIFFGMLLLFVSLFSLLLIFVVPSGVDFVRPLRFMALFLQIFGGITLYNILKYIDEYYLKRRMISKFRIRILSFIPYLFLYLLITISVFNIHYSPFVFKPNEQVTEMQLSGCNWLLDNKNPVINIVGIEGISWYTNIILGNALTMERHDITPIKIQENYVGEHFEKLFSRNWMQPRYVYYNNFQKLFYTLVLPAVDRFNPNDFKNLEENNYIYKIFDNRDFIAFIYIP